MPAPTVSPLPAAPRRVNDPDNFSGNYPPFLNALATYRTQSNSLATYLNALPFLKYQWGKVTDTPLTYVSVTPLSAAPAPGEAGSVFALKTETLFAGMTPFSVMQQNAGQALDALSLVSEATGATADPSRPVIPTLSTAPAASQPPVTFEANAVPFFSGVVAYAQKIGDMSLYYYTLLAAPEDFGLTTEAVTESDDYGLITETSDG